MTSAEIAQLPSGEPPEEEPAAQPGDTDQARAKDRRNRNGAKFTPAASPTGPATPPGPAPGAAKPAAPATASPTDSLAPSVPVPPGGRAAAPGGVAPPPGAPPAAQPAPPPAAPPPPPPTEQEPPPGPDLGEIASQAMPMVLGMAPMAAMMLPMLASALGGLGGGGGAGAGTVPGTTAPGTGSSGGSSGSSGGSASHDPEAERALRILNILKELYAKGDTETADALLRHLAATDSQNNGSGNASDSMKSRALFQRNEASALNRIDNDLYSFITKMAGDNKIAKNKIIAIIRKVNVELDELGPEAFTKTGKQKVRAILTEALQDAQKVVGDSDTSAKETAAAINNLTNQYRNNLAGISTTAPNAVSSAARKAIDIAESKLGRPYVWGAEGPNSFDCSGLMQYAAGKAGVRLPRIAADQYRLLPKVNRDQIRPGDLIFPSSSFSGKGAGHVMMYVGDGKCIHAPRPGTKVTVTSLPKQYRATRWT